MVDVDVTDDDSLDACFAALKDRWGTMDFLIHAIAFSDKNELTGRFINTTRGNFTEFAGDFVLFLHRRVRAARPS